MAFGQVILADIGALRRGAAGLAGAGSCTAVTSMRPMLTCTSVASSTMPSAWCVWLARLALALGIERLRPGFASGSNGSILAGGNRAGSSDSGCPALISGGELNGESDLLATTPGSLCRA